MAGILVGLSRDKLLELRSLLVRQNVCRKQTILILILAAEITQRLERLNQGKSWVSFQPKNALFLILSIVRSRLHAIKKRRSIHKRAKS